MAQKKVHYTITDHEIVIENRYWNEDEDMTDIVITTIRLDERTVTVRYFDRDGFVLFEETRSFDKGHEKYDIERLLTMAIRDDD